MHIVLEHKRPGSHMHSRAGRPAMHETPLRSSLTFTTDLAAVRELVRRHARKAGLADNRAVDLVIAVSEVAANTVQHARTSGRLVSARSGGLGRMASR